MDKQIHTDHGASVTLRCIFAFHSCDWCGLQCFDAVSIGIWSINTEWWVAGMVICLERGSELQTCLWPSWYHCHSLSLASVKPRLVLPFWYQLTRVVPEKGPLNVCVRACMRACDWCGLVILCSNTTVCVCVRYSSRPSCRSPVHGRRRRRPMMLARKISDVDRTSWNGRRQNWNVGNVRCNRLYRDSVSLLDHFSSHKSYSFLLTLLPKQQCTTTTTPV